MAQFVLPSRRGFGDIYLKLDGLRGIELIGVDDDRLDLPVFCRLRQRRSTISAPNFFLAGFFSGLFSSLSKSRPFRTAIRPLAPSTTDSRVVTISPAINALIKATYAPAKPKRALATYDMLDPKIPPRQG